MPLRVIAGEARGRPLRAPKNAPTRPTADLIRGAIFSMLEAEALKRGYDIDDEGVMASGQAWPRVLDLYAGSGALGIEALSRGARQAEFVERDAEAVRALEANLQTLSYADRAVVHKRAAEHAVRGLRGPFDAVFLDPPYEDADSLAATLDALSSANLLKDSSVVVLEQGAESTPPESVGPLPRRDTRKHGRTRISLYAAPRR